MWDKLRKECADFDNDLYSYNDFDQHLFILFGTCVFAEVLYKVNSLMRFPKITFFVLCKLCKGLYYFRSISYRLAFFLYRTDL